MRGDADHSAESTASPGPKPAGRRRSRPDDHCEYPGCGNSGQLQRCRNADRRLVCPQHGILFYAGASHRLKCLMCYEDEVRAALKWPPFWPDYPTPDDQASVLTSHAEGTITWWRGVLKHSMLPVASDTVTSWSAPEWRRLVMFAEVMSAAGEMRFVEPEVAAQARKWVLVAEFKRQRLILKERLMHLTPGIRALALFGNKADPGQQLEDPEMTLTMVMDLALQKRLHLRQSLAGSFEWLDPLMALRVQAACGVIDQAAADVGEKVGHWERAAGGTSGGAARVQGSGCAVALICLLLLCWLALVAL